MQTPSPRVRPVDSVEATDFLEPQRKANSEFAVLNNSFKTDAICCDRCGKWRPWPANLPGILMGQNDDDDKEDEGKDDEEKDEDDDDDDEDAASSAPGDGASSSDGGSASRPRPYSTSSRGTGIREKRAGEEVLSGR